MKIKKRRKCENLITVLAFFTVLLMLNGCGSRTGLLHQEEQLSSREHLGQKKNRIDIIRALEHHYKNWQGTKYKMGGFSRSGIDCSGFVQLTYRELFGISLPRTTTAQLKKGRRIAKSSLQAGDLVFFKTGWSQKHVGIYLKDGLFMHASRSQGVIISSIGNQYWRRNFLDAKRL